MKVKSMTLGELEDWLQGMSWEEVEQALLQLEQDPRKGVHKLRKRWENMRDKNKKDGIRWRTLCRREDELREKGWRRVAGIDEAGRGPLAGPVVAAAVILAEATPLGGLNDSKRLTPRQRLDLYRQITSTAVAWAVGSSGPEYIDATNILQATRRAMMTALEKLPVSPDYLLLDAVNLPEIVIPQEGIVGGDGKCACIAAASIVAKVTRDRLMEEWDRQYPEYGFAKHKGYPTPEHFQALRKFGPSPIHRRSFQPLAGLFPAGRVAETGVGEGG